MTHTALLERQRVGERMRDGDVFLVDRWSFSLWSRDTLGTADAFRSFRRSVMQPLSRAVALHVSCAVLFTPLAIK